MQFQYKQKQTLAHGQNHPHGHEGLINQIPDLCIIYKRNESLSNP